ncbi:MAG: family NAD(P)-dependent oxidoreductase [Mycobacterium sp.]|nr:family NAD(P)-dependent oxidoreductase [Mycobacterium sp.]
MAVPLDVTSDASIQAAAHEASDTTIVINNAGVLTHELLSTNTFRLELAPQGIHMLGLHLAHTDTPMATDVHEPKNDPAVVVRLAYEGLLAAEYEVLADEFTVVVKAGLAANIEDLYPELERV